MYATESVVDAMLADPEAMIRTLTALKEERAKRALLEAQVEADAPKVVFAAASVRERISCSSSRPENLERLARVRDPVAASVSRTADTFSAVSRAHRMRHAGE